MRTILLAALCCCAAPAYALSVASPAETFIYTNDKNDDLRLSLEEFLAVNPADTGDLVISFPITREAFRRLDRNRNGYLDADDRLEGIDHSDRVKCYATHWPRSTQPGVCPE